MYYVVPLHVVPIELHTSPSLLQHKFRSLCAVIVLLGISGRGTSRAVYYVAAVSRGKSSSQLQPYGRTTMAPYLLLACLILLSTYCLAETVSLRHVLKTVSSVPASAPSKTPISSRQFTRLSDPQMTSWNCWISASPLPWMAEFMG